jgi:asparagine synthase (glutamine-hydrolysing)
MCGIICLSENFKNRLDMVFKLLNHRGPDKKNFICSNDKIIGHNLLQIRGDIESSIQPKYAKGKKYILAFNGQIYNTDELKEQFSIDRSIDLDTEILVKVIDKIGIEFIKYIKGMYAILLYDTEQNKIHLFRDPSGQKHLYYHFNRNKLIICSEIKPIINILEDFNLNRENILSNLILGYPIDSSTIYNNIQRVLPGEHITLDQTYKINKYFFDLKKTLFPKNDPAFAINQTVKNHLLTKKKISINLSGGLDSNIILYEALKFNPEINVFSTHFECDDAISNHDYNLAKQISEFYGLKLHTTHISFENYLDNFESSFLHIEEINRNINNPVYYLNYKNQKENNFRSIISGDGGDEIFVGYDYYRRSRYYIEFLDKIKISKTLSTFLWFKEYVRYNSFDKNYIKYDLIDKIRKSFKILKNSQSAKKFYDSFYNCDVEHAQKFFCFLDQFNWLSNETFLRADKLGMKNNLEVRSPFSDFDLRSYFFDRMDKSKFREKINKPEIRQVYQGKLNPIITENLKKTGWSIPKQWLKNDQLKEKIVSIIPDHNCEIIKWKNIKDMIKKNELSLQNKKIYNLISLAIIKNGTSKIINNEENYN